jgi:outer membrane murein-binding lipoprotein Lpp
VNRSSRARTSAIAALAAVALSAGLLAGCGGSDLPEGVAAQVAGLDVKQAELDQAINQQKAAAEQQQQDFPEAGSDEYVALQRQVLEGLVFLRIVALEAKECGKPCLATPAQIAAERKKVIAQNFSGKPAKFTEFIAEQGLTDADVNRILRSGIEEPRVTRRVTNGITFTPAQARTYCRANRQEFRRPASREASHILVKTKAEADSVRAQASSGNFASLARQYSTDPGSKNQGGSLGAIQKGALVPEFEKVAFTLKDGAISPPVKTQFGWHVITVNITPARDIPCDEAQKQIIESQTQVKRNAAVQAWRTKVVAKWQPQTAYADSALAPATSTTGT